MKKMLLTTACALMLSTTFAAAQSSMGKGGAPVTNETADPTKAPNNSMSKEMDKDAMKSNNMGTSGMSNDKMGGANKNGDGQMTKGGMNK